MLLRVLLLAILRVKIERLIYHRKAQIGDKSILQKIVYLCLFVHLCLFSTEFEDPSAIPYFFSDLLKSSSAINCVQKMKLLSHSQYNIYTSLVTQLRGYFSQLALLLNHLGEILAIIKDSYNIFECSKYPRKRMDFLVCLI